MLAAGILLSAPACSGGKSQRNGGIDPAPTMEELRSATIHDIPGIEGDITLSGGRWEGEPFVEGGASRPSVMLIGDLYLSGDVTGDGAGDAVVFLSTSSGGSGTFLYLAVFQRLASGVTNAATAPIGDRVQIRRVAIQEGLIRVDVVQAGDDDAMCCPGDLVTRSWECTNGVTTELKPIPEGRLSVSILADTDWVLKEWSWDEFLGAEPALTLRYENGQFLGFAGCNQYFTRVEEGATPGDIKVGPAASSKRACPEPEMALETRFLGQLEGVRKYGFISGRLALTYRYDGVYSTMLFERAAQSR